MVENSLIPILSCWRVLRLIHYITLVQVQNDLAVHCSQFVLEYCFPHFGRQVVAGVVVGREIALVEMHIAATIVVVDKVATIWRED